MEQEPTRRLGPTATDMERKRQRSQRGDVQGATPGTDDRDFALRAERSGTGTGRNYVITYKATDASGNSATAEARVTVPHNQ